MEAIKNNSTVDSVNKVKDANVNKTKNGSQNATQTAETNVKMSGLDAVSSYNKPIVKKKEHRLSSSDLNKLASFATELDLGKNQIASVKKYLGDVMHKNKLQDLSELGKWYENLYDNEMYNEYVGFMIGLQEACGIDSNDDKANRVDSLFDKYLAADTEETYGDDYFLF